MMHLTTRFCFICISLCVLFLTEAVAKDDALTKADSLFVAGQWFDASIAYERSIYQDQNGANIRYARMQKSLCYKNLGEYPKALKELNTINLLGNDKQTINRILYEKAFCQYILKQYPEALLNFNRIQIEDSTSLQALSFLPLKVLILNNLRTFEDAQNTCSFLIEKSTVPVLVKDSLQVVVSELYHKKKLPKAYTEKKAKHLSRFLPGAGQTYTGHLGEGAVSLLLNAGLLGFGIYQLYLGYYFTAYIGGFAVFYRTYSGGIQRAEYLAKLESENKINEFNNQIIELLEIITSSGKDM